MRTRGRAIAVALALLSSGCSASPDGLYPGSRPSFVGKTNDFVASLRVHGNGRIYRFNEAGVGVALTTDGYAADPSVSADGQMVVFSKMAVEEHRANIWTMKIDGTEARQLTSIDSFDALPVFTKSGGAVVFARSIRVRATSTGGRLLVDWDLYEVRLKDHSERRITNDLFRRLASVALSADGNHILIGREPNIREYPNLEMNILEIDLRTGTSREIGLDGDHQATMTGDGRIVFIRNAGDFNYEIFSMDGQGEDRKQLTNLSSYTDAPVVSPDMRRVLFSSDPRRRHLFHLEELDLVSLQTRPVHLTYTRD